MARDWRRAVLAAIAALMLGSACALGVSAQQAEEEQDRQSGESAKKDAKKKQDPAEAQHAVEVALKQVEAGRADQAVQAMTATMAAGNLPPAIMAKALYVRGMAYRKQGRPAQAISDFTAALWLKGGLGGEERDDALREKAAAYADAGLNDPGESKPPAPKSSDGGGGGASAWFNSFFGGFGGSQQQAPPPKKTAPTVTSAPVETPKAPSSWSGKTDVQEPPRAPPPKAPRTAKAPAPVSSGRKLDGHYLVQLAAMRTEAEARALASKAKREHGALLGSRNQSIDRFVYGNMGAFYRAQFGPFASEQETQMVCAKLQGSGIDCLPVTQ